MWSAELQEEKITLSVVYKLQRGRQFQPNKRVFQSAVLKCIESQLHCPGQNPNSGIFQLCNIRQVF